MSEEPTPRMPLLLRMALDKLKREEKQFAERRRIIEEEVLRYERVGTVDPARLYQLLWTAHRFGMSDESERDER